MSDATLAYVAGCLCVVWGIAHIAATAPVLRGFGTLSRDNRLTLTMAWVGGGLTLVFLGVLVLLVTRLVASALPVSIVYLSVAGMLVAMGALGALTGARTKAVPMRICPFIQVTAACLLVLAA